MFIAYLYSLLHSQVGSQGPLIFTIEQKRLIKLKFDFELFLLHTKQLDNVKFETPLNKTAFARLSQMLGLFEQVCDFVNRTENS